MNDKESGARHSAFSGRMKAAREAQNLTREELAARLGLTEKTIAGWESGAARPRSNKTQILAAILNVSLRWLISGIRETEDEGVQDTKAPARDDALREILTEMRELKSELTDTTKRLNRLEKQLEEAL